MHSSPPLPFLFGSCQFHRLIPFSLLGRTLSTRGYVITSCWSLGFHTLGIRRCCVSWAPVSIRVVRYSGVVGDDRVEVAPARPGCVAVCEGSVAPQARG